MPTLSKESTRFFIFTGYSPGMHGSKLCYSPWLTVHAALTVVMMREIDPENIGLKCVIRSLRTALHMSYSQNYCVFNY